MFILRPTFQKPFELYDRIASSCITVEGLVNKIADKETKSSLYDLGELIVERQIKTYNIAGTNVQFRVNELYGAKLLHAKTETNNEWSFITKFDCN